MAAEKERGGGRREIFGGGLRDAQLGAAGVGDERVLGSEAGDFREEVDRDADGERDVDEIGGAEGGSEVAGEGFVDDVARTSFADDFGAVPAGDVQVGGVFAEGEGEGAADEAGAEDGGAREDVWGHGGEKIAHPSIQGKETQGRKGSRRGDTPKNGGATANCVRPCGGLWLGR